MKTAGKRNWIIIVEIVSTIAYCNRENRHVVLEKATAAGFVWIP
jgi:hypothetical protein